VHSGLSPSQLRCYAPGSRQSFLQCFSSLQCQRRSVGRVKVLLGPASRRGRSELMGSVFFVIWDQRTAGFRRLIFFEMRHTAAPAFKRTYIGQCAETLRPSYQSHVLSAAWAQRQLRPRAFSIHDEARFSAIHARLHWLPLLLEHSLAVVEARERTPQICAKAKTDGALTHYKCVAIGLLQRTDMGCPSRAH
jgi:hypothetical protein